MTQIIGFAGKKQSGKNTCCNFVMMLKLIEENVCKRAKLDDNGEILVSDIFGEEISEDYSVQRASCKCRCRTRTNGFCKDLCFS